MKQVAIIFLVGLFCTGLQAQEDYTKSLDGVEWVKIESRAKVVVKAYSEKQLLIKGGKMHNKPDRAKGLKLVGEGGTDNTNVGYYVIKEGSDLIVRNLQRNNNGNTVIYLPASQNVSIRTKGTSNGDIVVSGFKGEVEATVEINGGMRLEDVSGPLTVSTLNGGIDVSFSKISQDSPISIYSTNGALDINLPESTPADLAMSTMNGEIYTNFELKFPEKNGLKSVSTQKIQQVINGGGVKFKLRTINGNIYLRKQ